MPQSLRTGISDAAQCMQNYGSVGAMLLRLRRSISANRFHRRLSLARASPTLTTTSAMSSNCSVPAWNAFTRLKICL